jgi:hypothetical protein
LTNNDSDSVTVSKLICNCNKYSKGKTQRAIKIQKEIETCFGASINLWRKGYMEGKLKFCRQQAVPRPPKPSSLGLPASSI